VEFDSILNGCPNHIYVICIGRQQKLIFFFQLHTIVKLFFNDITIFKTKHWHQLQPDDDISWALMITGSYFDKPVKQTQRQAEFAETGVWFILVALIYLESAKFYTGPCLKIVRVSKRLRNIVNHLKIPEAKRTRFKGEGPKFLQW